MVKCPNCSSIAQIRIVDRETYKGTLSIYLTYKCECGCKFTTRTEIDGNNEKLYEIIEEGGLTNSNPHAIINTERNERKQNK